MKMNIEEAKAEITPSIINALSAMSNPVLKAYPEEFGNDEVEYDDIEDIASVIADDYKHHIVCGVHAGVVTEKLSSVVRSGYSWLNNGIEFYLTEKK